MLTLAYDNLVADDARTQIEIWPNCQWPSGSLPPAWRYSCFTLAPLAMLRADRLLCERTDRLVGSGRPFVYPLELRYNMRESLAANPLLAPGIPTEVLARVRAGRAIILVWIGHEPTPLDIEPGKTWVFDAVQQLITDHDLPPQQVWFISGNLIGMHTFGQWLRARRLYEAEAFRFRTLAISPGSVQARYRANRRGYDLSAGQRDDSWVYRTEPCDAAAFASRYIDPAELAEERSSGRIRPKRFLSFNNRASIHRQLLVAYLSGKGWLDGSLVSFHGAGATDLERDLDFPVDREFLRESWRRLLPRLPLTVDAMAGVADHHRVQDGWPYRESYFNIVTETEIGYGCSPFSTEKAMKPISNLQPFILVSTTHTLRYMHAIGFKSFAGVIDETYDSVPQPHERIQWIFKEIDRLAALSPAEARDRYFACLPELEHNRAHLIDGRHELEDLFDELEAQLG
jgi:hypothetical protein